MPELYHLCASKSFILRGDFVILYYGISQQPVAGLSQTNHRLLNLLLISYGDFNYFKQTFKVKKIIHTIGLYTVSKNIPTFLTVTLAHALPESKQSVDAIVFHHI